MSNLSRQASPVPDRQARGVVLAIDYGEKRLGLALSDESGLISRPHATWNRTNRRRDLARLRELTREHGVRQIIVGLPLHLDGTASEMSERAKSFAARTEKALGIPVAMVDERLTSWEAQQALNASGRKPGVTGVSSRPGRSKGKTSLDQVAAAILLQDYLDQSNARAEWRV